MNVESSYLSTAGPMCVIRTTDPDHEALSRLWGTDRRAEKRLSEREQHVLKQKKIRVTCH